VTCSRDEVSRAKEMTYSEEPTLVLWGLIVRMTHVCVEFDVIRFSIIIQIGNFSLN